MLPHGCKRRRAVHGNDWESIISAPCRAWAMALGVRTFRWVFYEGGCAVFPFYNWRVATEEDAQELVQISVRVADRNKLVSCFPRLRES